MNNRVFFTSIPKCGKNIVYSLLLGLGYKRHNHADEEYARLAYARRFDRINYVYPSAQSARGWDGFAAELDRMAPNSVFHRHLLPHPEFTSALRAAGIRPLLIIRDPRDALLSAANYALSGKPAHIVEHLTFRDTRGAAIGLLEGHGGTVPFAEQFDAYFDWMRDKDILVIRFEDIIGEKGGGDANRQLACVTRLLEHIGHRNVAMAEDSVRNAFNPRAGTFFKGQIGSWRAMADQDLDRRFLERAGHLLKRWGYE